VWAEVSPALGTAREVATRLKAAGVLASALGANVVRFVTHLDVSRADCERAAAAIRALSGARA
jgi:threonine aldolase